MEITSAALLEQTLGFSMKAVKVFSSQGFVASVVHPSPIHLLFFSSYAGRNAKEKVEQQKPKF